MRKTAKIFSVILCLALLVGAIMMTVSAEVTPKTDLIPNGAEMVGVSGFTKYDIWTTASSINSMDKITVGGKEKGVIETGNWGTGGYAPEIETSEANGNTYFVRRHSVSEYGAPVHANKNGPYDGFKMGNGDVAYNTASDRTDTDGTKADFSLMHFDYVTVDFDLASDMYLDSEGKLTDENTGKLAYLSGSYLGFLARNKNGQQQSGWESVKIIYSNNTWYLQKNDDTTVRTPLSANVGEWNHLTFVFKINTVKGGAEEAPTYKFDTSRCYLYVNGEYFFDMGWSGATEMDEATAETYGFDSIRFNYPRSHTEVEGGYKGSHGTEFSILSDNLSVNYYKKGYTGELASFIAKDPTASISECNDVIFNPAYQFELPNMPVATVESAGVATDYYSLNGALSAIEEGCTLTLYGDTKVENYVAFCNFTVVCDEGEFTLGQCQKVANRTSSGYEITKAKSTQQFTVYYYPTYDDASLGKNEIVMEGDQNTATVNQPIFIPSLPSGTFGNVTDNGIEYKLLTKWQLFYYVGEDEVSIDLTPETVIDDATLAVINRENDGEVYAYPVYEKTVLQYIITDSIVVDEATTTANLLRDSKDGYAQYKDIATLDEEVTANSNKKVYIKLYADFRNDYVAAGGNASSTVDGSDVVYLDMNGHSYIVNADAYATNNAQNKPSAFSISNNAEFHVYSSKPGARIINMSYQHNKTYAWGGSVFGIASKSTNVKLYLGAYSDSEGNKFSGDNLYVSGALAVSLAGTGWWNSGITPSKASVYIDGGMYVRPNPDSYGLIKADGDLTVNVTGNAFFYGYNLISTDARYDGKLTMNVDGATFIAPATASNKSDYSIVNQLQEGSVITFKNTNIIGNITLTRQSTYAGAGIVDGDERSVGSTKGTIYFGAGTKLAGGFDVTAPNAKALDGTMGVVIEEAYEKKFSWYVPEYKVVDTTNYKGALVESCLTTAVEVAKTATFATKYISTEGMSIANVTWYDSDKTTKIGDDILILGYTALGPIDSVTKIELDNIWFDLAFGYWADKATGEKFDFATIEDGKTYELYAVCTTPVADVTAYQNVDLRSKFTTNFYFPYADAENGVTITVDGVEYKITNSKYFSGNAEKTTTYRYNHEGNKLAYFTVAFPAPTDFAGSATYSMSFDVTVNGVTTTVKSKDLVATGLGTYLPKAFELAKDDATKKLVLNIMQYCAESYKLADLKAVGLDASSNVVKNLNSSRSYYNNFVEMLSAAENKQYIKDIESEEFNAALDALEIKNFAIPTELAAHVSGITFYITAGTPTIAIVPTDTTENTTITAASVNMGKWKGGNDYTLSFHRDVTSYHGNCTDSGYWLNINSHANAEFLGNEYVFSVTVKTGEETTATYKINYNLATYIASLEALAEKTVDSEATTYDDVAVQKQTVKAIKALYAYSEAMVEFVTTPEAK